MRYEDWSDLRDESVGLTPFRLRFYITSMFCKSVAAFVVAIWLALLGVDFLGDTGFIPYLGSETDRAVDSVLTAYEQATDISDDAPLTIRPILATHPGAFFSPSLIHSVSTECVNKEKPFLRENIPLYKFHLVFLI